MRGLVWLTIASAFAKKPADGAHPACTAKMLADHPHFEHVDPASRPSWCKLITECPNTGAALLATSIGCNGLLPLHAGGRPRHTRVHQRVRLRARRGEAGVVGRPEDRQRWPAAGHGDDADFE